VPEARASLGIASQARRRRERRATTEKTQARRRREHRATTEKTQARRRREHCTIRRAYIRAH